jgi:hypothetical protein
MTMPGCVARFLALACLSGLMACGGGGSEGDAAPPAPLPPAGTVIGPAGGTVTGPNGASVVIPAGALAIGTRINIEQSDVGAPPLPNGFSTVGFAYNFTPHGTTFAVPVTMTLPFDPATVPAGRTPEFYKSNAQDQWENFPDATFGTTSVSASVSSFSGARVVLPPVSVTTVVRSYSFRKLLGDALEEQEVDAGVETVDMDRAVDFGPAQRDAPYGRSGGVRVEPDGRAVGLVISIDQGNTFWIAAEAPTGNAAIETDAIGSVTRLVQYQRFRKNVANASYRWTLSNVKLQALDGNGVLARFCPQHRIYLGLVCDLLGAQYTFDFTAYQPDPATGNDVPTKVFYRVAGGEALYGSSIVIDDFLRWFVSETTSGQSRFSLESLGARFVAETGSFNGPGGTQEVRLTQPGVINLDLNSVPIGGEFMVRIITSVRSYNRAAGVVSGQGAEFPTAAVAGLRDPAEAVGPVSIVTSGLTPIDVPLPAPEPAEAPVEPAPCPAPDTTAGTLQFSAPGYVTDESTGVPMVTVTRTGGTHGAVSATVRTSNGSAIAGTDYTAVNASVFFADGDETPRTVEVPILPDTIAAEPDRTVNITLSEPGNCAVIGSQSASVLTIRDDDPLPPPTRFTVGGTVTGYQPSPGGGNLVLENHTGLFLEITAAGPFRFNQLPSLPGTSYFVRVFNQPRNLLGFQTQQCTVTNGAGVFGNSNVDNVVVTCVDL